MIWWTFLSGIALAMLSMASVVVLLVTQPRPSIAQAIALGVLGSVPFFYGLATAALAIPRRGRPL